MTEQLPILPSPIDSESLTSFLIRTAEANLLPPRKLLTFNNPDGLSTLSRFLNRPVGELTSMSVWRYPPAVTGGVRRRAQHWVVERHGWRCPSCFARTPILQRDWNVAFLPFCSSCELLLVRPGEQTMIPVDDRLARTAHLFAMYAQQSATRRDKASRLRRLRKVATLVGQTVDQEWPDREIWDVPLNPGDAAGWAPDPPASPGAVATVLNAVAHATAHQAERALVFEGLERLRDRDGAPAVPQSFLPNTPRSPRRPPEARYRPWTDLERRRLAALTTHVRWIAERHSIEQRHVPALLTPPGQSPLPENDWGYWAELAQALVILLDEDGVTSPTAACLWFDLNPTTPSRRLNGIWRHRGITSGDADRLEQAILDLSSAPTDYRARRVLFASSRRLPQPLRSRLARDDFDCGGFPPDLHARMWLWVHFTRGCLTSSPWRLTPTRLALDFDRHLDPELRLALREYGEDVCRQVDDDVTLAHPLATQRPSQELGR